MLKHCSRLHCDPCTHACPVPASHLRRGDLGFGRLSIKVRRVVSRKCRQEASLCGTTICGGWQVLSIRHRLCLCLSVTDGKLKCQVKPEWLEPDHEMFTMRGTELYVAFTTKRMQRVMMQGAGQVMTNRLGASTLPALNYTLICTYSQPRCCQGLKCR